MFFKGIIIFTLVAICSARQVCEPVATGNQCGADEVWTDCGPVDDCEPACDSPAEQACPAICLSKCVCKEGFVRASQNGDRTCIFKEFCP
ncbi:CLUMA_CG016367, isoform A [Clunio marinus]|uniref:CLUMA_CG016367, isoform A n=1 Tax=Clunio marinus TaxID=568069 RepID=A0A1J1ITA2_9DIPT|nr:CLUMA_CG016367, isoform A [Clunio marinus]